ncbi:MAG TPA: MBL fold metallo-hydrolase [Kofleriaceae bacterium]|jgi:ribonuclease Z|nr:MBL fold metallo-hydrolase [Kofleriaceae bacterium]
MLTSVRAGHLTVRGISVAGVYTSLHVPELDVLLDCGIALRSCAGAGTLLLSHGHADHAGALAALLGIRALNNQKRPLRVVMPIEIVDDVKLALQAMSALQRWPLEIDAIGVAPGDEVALKGDLHVRALKTYHPVPSLAYVFFRRVSKLKPEHAGMSGADIAARRKAGDRSIFEEVEQVELAYATDTLVQVLDREPALAAARVLMMECTFLDERKSLDAARAGCHVHLDELIERAEAITNPHVVLMHLSQIYRPDEVRGILDRRLPASLAQRVIAFTPTTHEWPG